MGGELRQTTSRLYLSTTYVHMAPPFLCPVPGYPVPNLLLILFPWNLGFPRLWYTVSADQMITVRNFTADQARRGARLLARAFAADPIITHFLDGFVRRQFAFPAFFRAIIREHLEGGHVYSAWEEDRLIGVAVWSPPEGITLSNPRLKTQAHFDHRIVRALFPRRSRGLYGGFAATASLHPHEPHWYLAFVGIDPQFQGQGVGQKLLGAVLDAADIHGVLCYLETPFPATHKFYQRLGFELGTQAKPFEGAPPLWTMVRRPRIVKADHFEK